MNVSLAPESSATAIRAENILDAVSFAAERFLAAENWTDHIQAVLARLGAATAVSRVHIFENRPRADGEPLASQRFEWIAQGIVPQIDNLALQNFCFQTSGFERWVTTLSAGEPIVGVIHTFPPAERALLESHDIRSIAVVPIFAGGIWWGHIGFDDCQSEREWSAPEIDALKTAAGMIGTAIGRARLYAELCENDRRYRRLVELSPAPILVHNNGQIVFINQAGVRLLGARTAEELTGASMVDLIHPDHRARAAARAQTAQPPQLPDDVVEETLVRLDRQLIDVEIVSVPTTYLGNEATQVVIRDITEHKRGQAERQAFEQRLLETQKLESLGVLAGGIAHEFNNLLMGVLGNTTLAKREIPSDSPAQYSLTKIEGAANRAAELTQQLLVYSGRKQFTLQIADLNLLVEEMSRLAQVSFGRETRLVLQLGELPPIQADPAQLRQLILNLVTNAAEAIGEASGRLVVSTGRQQLSSAFLATTYLQPNLPSGEYVYLTVSDDGPGMDKATQARIFEPFFTTKFPGRGLGLAAALGVVRGQRGALKVRSAPGQGSAFTVYFPSSALVSSGSLVEAATESKHAADGMILVVEDDTDIRVLATRVLERLGFAVVAAADGAAGVELFRTQADEIACVLLDMHMPRMDGRQALQEILAIRPDARVLLMTSDDDWQSTAQLNGLNLAGVVHKPFSTDYLHAQVRRAIASRMTAG